MKTVGKKGGQVWLGPLAIAATTVVMILRGWLRWPDTLVDYGQQLYVAWRICEGQVLYRDFAYLHGPLSAYVQAGVMGWWGTSLLTLVFFNLLVLIGLIVLLYRLLASLSSRYAASMACLFFVVVFAFAQYLALGNYNYISPYTSEATHGLVLALAAIALMIRFMRQGQVGALVGAGFLLGMVFLTKAEVFLAVAVALGVGVVLASWKDRVGWRVGAGRAAILTSTALLPPIIAWAAFCLVMSPRESFDGVTTAYSALFGAGASDLLFYRSRMGLDQPWVHLRRMAMMTSWYVVLLLPALLVSLFAGKRRYPWLIAALPVIFAAWQVQSTAWFQAARPLPLLMLVLILIAAGACLRARSGAADRWADSAPGVLILALFALMLLVKIVLNSRVYHYGFVLAMPATLLLVLCLTDWIPLWIDHRGGRGAVFRAVGTALLAIALVAHFQVSDRRLQAKDHLVSYGGDAFWSDGRAQAVNEILRYLESSSDANSTLLVVPDGIMLNYLARIPTPAPYLNYVPTEVFTFGEETILDHWHASPPDYVAVVEKSTAEFGYRYFGVDYAESLWQWIEQQYATVKVVGAEPLTGRGFGIRLMKRRE